MQKSDKVLIAGFPPIADRNARALILGTMPSVASLDKQQYYGHPRNAFWPIMGALFGAYPGFDYESRKQILIANNIAVWDVLKTCYRPGSMDSAIARESIICNDFKKFIGQHRALKRVYFNGGTAEKLFYREVLADNPELASLQFHRLPSTSPAYAAMTLAEKIQRWRVMII